MRDTLATSPEGTLTLLHLPDFPINRLESFRCPLGELQESRFLPALTPTAWQRAHAKALDVLDQAQRLGVQILTAFSPGYPSRLHQIADRPPVLYVRGTLPLHNRCVACVGTREPTAFGRNAAKVVAGAIAASGWSIVSGLAIGIDALSHEAALRALGHTTAILANGLDTLYPHQHERLAAQILEQDGCVLSEQPFGTPATAPNLIRRNRLQSGMSAATIAFQTDLIGGTMHTVRFTLMQERPLFVPVPHGAHTQATKSRGILALVSRNGPALTNLLKAEGAYAKQLTTRFASQPPATPIRKVSTLLQQLEAISKQAPMPTTSAPEQLALI